MNSVIPDNRTFVLAATVEREGCENIGYGKKVNEDEDENYTEILETSSDGSAREEVGRGEYALEVVPD